MATILDFRPAVQKLASGPSANDALAAGTGGSAELIFFPGVRYDRAEAAPGPAPRKRSAKSRGRAHDQIELPD